MYLAASEHESQKEETNVDKRVVDIQQYLARARAQVVMLASLTLTTANWLDSGADL